MTRPFRPEDMDRFEPITEAAPQPARPPTRTSANMAIAGADMASPATAAIDRASAEAATTRRPITSAEAGRFEPIEQVHSAREQAAGRGIGDFIAFAFDPTEASRDPNTDASAFLNTIRRDGQAARDEQARIAAATGDFADRWNAVREDTTRYGIADVTGNISDAETALGRAVAPLEASQDEADRRDAYARGFEGREFWNTDEINVPMPYGPLARLMGRAPGEGVTLRGPAAATAAGVADISGAITGAMQDPTSILGGGETLVQRILSNMAWNAGTDIAGQFFDIGSGAQEDGYQPERTAMSTAAGAVLPTAFHIVGEAVRNPKPRVEAPPAGDEASTARASRGTNDGVSSEAEARAGEDAANRARAVLRERGVNPNQPGYRQAFEAERAVQMRDAQPAPAAEPSADYTALAREALASEGVTPRNDENFATTLQQRATQLAETDTPQARQARADAEAQAQAAFETALRADPQARVRTNSRGNVTYVRDTGKRARGRAIVEVVELDPETGTLRSTGRTIQALPRELSELSARRSAATTGEIIQPGRGDYRGMDVESVNDPSRNTDDGTYRPDDEEMAAWAEQARTEDMRDAVSAMLRDGLDDDTIDLVLSTQPILKPDGSVDHAAQRMREEAQVRYGYGAVSDRRYSLGRDAEAEDRAALPSPVKREPLSERDTSRIPTLPTDAVVSRLKTDPGATVRVEGDQQIVRNAAERGVDQEAVDRYRRGENDVQPQEGRVDPQRAEWAVRDRLSEAERATLEADDPILAAKENPQPHMRDDETATFTRRNTRSARERLEATVSRETGLTNKSERSRAVTNATAQLVQGTEVRAPRVSRETGLTNKSEPQAPRDPNDTTDVPLAPRAAAATAPPIERVTLDVGGRASHFDASKPDNVGDVIRFNTFDEADAAAKSWSRNFEQAGLSARVERDDGGFHVRTIDAPQAVAGPAARADAAPVRRTIADETPKDFDAAQGKQFVERTVALLREEGTNAVRATDEQWNAARTKAEAEVRGSAEADVAEPDVKTQLREFGEELSALTRELRRQRSAMDDKVANSQSRAMQRGAPNDTPAAREADAPPARGENEMPTPEPVKYRSDLYDDDYVPPQSKGEAADSGLSPREQDIEADRPGLVEATRRREALAAAQRGEAFGERARSVDSIPDWRHDVTPDRMARDFLEENSRATDIDRVAAIVKSGRSVAAVLDSTGKMHRLPGTGNVTWTRSFARRAALSGDVNTGQILHATRSADVYGHGSTVYVRVSEDASDDLVNSVMRTTRALNAADPDLEIRLEVHPMMGGDPTVHVGWAPAKKALDAIVDRGYQSPHNSGTNAFRFMDPTLWGMRFADAVEHARSSMGQLLGDMEFLPRGDIADRMRVRDPNVVAVNAKGQAFQTPFGESSYFFQRFRKKARIGLPDGVRTNMGRRVAGYLEHDVLNSTRTAVLENYGGKAELRMPERLTRKTAEVLREAVAALPENGIRARVFSEDGASPMHEGRAAVLEAINSAEQAGLPKADRANVVGAMPFLDPAAWKRFLVEPSMRAFQRYVDTFHKSDPDRVAFWRDLHELMSQPPKSGKHIIGAQRAVSNLHDTMVVSDIGALRGLARRYPDLKFSADDAKAMGDPTLEGKNPITWLADQVGSQPGSGRVIPRAYEQEVAQDTKRFLRRVDRIMSDLEAGRRLTDAEHKAFAELVTGSPVSGAVTPAMEAAARAVRSAFDDEWKASQAAGMSLGNRKNYLARNFDEDLVVRNPQRFIDLARDQWVDEGLDPTEALAKARSLWTNIAMPASRRLRINAETAGTPNPIAARQWSASADARMREFYVNDIRKIAPSYIRRIATARAFARRFGQKGERLQATYDVVNRSIERDADRDLIQWHMNNALGHHAQQHGRLPQTIAGALSWVQVFGVTKFLARTFLLQAVEPGNIAMRESKGLITSLEHVVKSVGYLFDNTPRAQAEAQLADIIGLTGGAAKELYLDARLNGLVGTLPRRFINNVFDSYGITHMTERQRIYAMTVGEQAIRVALHDVSANSPNSRAAQSLLGEYGISKDQAPGMLRWLESLDRLPREDRLEAIGYGEFENARAFRGALHDFAVKSIIEPTAADTPGFAKHPWMRLAYSLSSFQHAFTREALLRMTVQLKRAITDGTLTREDAAQLMAVAPAFLGLATMQILVQTLRASVFSSQASNEQTPLEKTITNISRTGAFGIYDTAINTLSSNLRYERDPAGLASGPFLGDSMNSLFEVVQGLPVAPSNSPNTNSAEWQAVKEGYSTIVAPAAAGMAAQVPLPPWLNLVRVGASAYGTSSDASRSVATSIAGERLGRSGGGGAETYDDGGAAANGDWENYE